MEDPAQIKQEIIAFYQQLFGHSNIVYEGAMMNRVSDLMSPKISAETRSFLLQAVTDDEVKGPMFSLGSEKAPGPDGFTTHFFKKAWSLLEEMFAYQ